MSEPPSERITVGSVMHSPVVMCAPDATLRTVAALLAEHRIHAVVVAAPDTFPRSYGIVSDRDVVRAHAQGGLDSRTAREAASEPSVTVRADLDLRYASELMARQGTTHLVVVSPEAEAPVGVVSSLDIAEAVALPSRP